MKILWLCNIVLPELADEFGIKKARVGGWLTGVWEQLKTVPDMDLAICVPIYDENRMKDGMYSNYQYYSFHYKTKCEDLDLQIRDFEHILDCFRPDIIHIWGTEFQHSYAMMKICIQRNMGEQVIVNIQGLVSACARHLRVGLSQSMFNCLGIKELYCNFYERGELEKKILSECKYVMGRTSWDLGCVSLINPNVNYIFCGEILRSEFYESQGKWSYETCEPHSIFISQASYPIKGFHMVIDELGLLYQKYPDLNIYIAGRPPQSDGSEYGAYIDSLIEKNHLETRVHFVGVLDSSEMIRQYCKANVFLSASTIENSPNSVCEAMMIGTPVVASCVGGLQSIIDHGQNGYIYPLNEPYMMRNYLISIFENKQMADTISKNETRFVREYNDRKKVMEVIVDTYHKLGKK